MQPQQPYISPTSNPYEFITSPPPPQKPTLLGNGSSMMQRTLIVVSGGAILLIIFIIFMAFLSGSSNNGASLTPIAQHQNEIIRVAALGTQQAVNQSTKNIAVNSRLSLTTQQQQLISYLKTHQGQTLTAAQLAASKNSNTDKQLTTAAAASTFDSTFVQIMQSELTNYAQSIKRAFGTTTKTSERQLLNNEYSGARLLLQQLSSAQPSS